MSFSVFNKEKIDFKKEPLFFGQGRNIQEYADPKYPNFVKLDEEMESLFWRPSEVSLQKDRVDFKAMSADPQFIFVANLQYQILLDSIQGRSPLLMLLPIVTNPELEACVISWGFFEKIHSKSYTYMIRNLFADPSIILNPILDIPEIIERAQSIGEYYDAANVLIQQWIVDPDGIDKRALYKAVYLALVCVNVLEGIRFYVSFACNFAFGENKVMEGSSKIMGLIARDESKHLTITQQIIRALASGSEGQLWVDVIAESEQDAIEIFKLAAWQEKAWATYLFKNRSMLGLTESILHTYIDHMVNKRMRALKYTPAFPTTPNPLTWMDGWLNSRGVQEAPQETEKESYLIGKVDTNVSDDDFAEFQF